MGIKFIVGLFSLLFVIFYLAYWHFVKEGDI